MSELPPSLHIYRPVLNVDQHTLDAMLATATLKDVPIPDEIQPRLYANLLGPGELRSAHEQFGTPLDEEGVTRLGDLLDSYLPPSSDETIIVPTLPSRLQRDKGRQKLLVGGNNMVAITERVVVQAFIKYHYAAPELSLEWPENDLPSWVLIGIFKRDSEGSRAQSFRDFLHQHPDLLPAKLELGPVSITNV